MNAFDFYKLYHKDFQMPTEKYYVYIHRNPLTDKVFYVGSAQGNCKRAYEFNKHRSPKWCEEVRSFGGICNIIVEIVQYCDNPFKAQETEFKLITKLKKNGEAYCNFEGSDSFKKKHKQLIYHVFDHDSDYSFHRKNDLYSFCEFQYGISKAVVKALLMTGEKYNGTKEKARGIRIAQEGKEHI